MIALGADAAEAPRVGDVVVADFAADRVLLSVDRVDIDASTSSPSDGRVHLSGKALWVRTTPYTWVDSSPPDVPAMAIERLGFDLWARIGADQAQRLGNLGLAPGHPRHVALLPDDEMVFGTTDWPDASMLDGGAWSLPASVRITRSFAAKVWPGVSGVANSWWTRVFALVPLIARLVLISSVRARPAFPAR